MKFGDLLSLLEQNIDLSNLDADIPYSDDIKRNRLTFDKIISNFEYPELFEDYLHGIARAYKYANFNHWLRYWLTPSERDENENEMYDGFMDHLSVCYTRFLKDPRYADKIRAAEQAPHLKNAHDMDLTF